MEPTGRTQMAFRPGQGLTSLHRNIRTSPVHRAMLSLFSSLHHPHPSTPSHKRTSINRALSSIGNGGSSRTRELSSHRREQCGRPNETRSMLVLEMLRNLIAHGVSVAIIKVDLPLPGWLICPPHSVLCLLVNCCANIQHRVSRCPTSRSMEAVVMHYHVRAARHRAPSRMAPINSGKVHRLSGRNPRAEHSPLRPTAPMTAGSLPLWSFPSDIRRPRKCHLSATLSVRVSQSRW